MEQREAVRHFADSPFIGTYTNIAGTVCSSQRLVEYASIVRRLATEHGAGIVDVYEITGNAAEWNDERFTKQFTDKLDGCHLNSKGQQLVYYSLLEELRSRIAK